jgi:hypothetical protein
MLCPSCGTKNNDYHLFCYQCGTALTTEAADASHFSYEEELSISYEGSDNIEAKAEESELNDWTKDKEEKEVSNDLAKDKNDEDASSDWPKVEEEFTTSTDDIDKKQVSALSEEADKSGENKTSIDLSWSDSFSDDWWNFDYTKGEFFKDDNKESEFNYQEQLPLRRYRKTDDEEDEGGRLQRIIKTFVSIVLIALIGVLIYVGYDQIRQRQSYQPEAKVIDLDYKVEETEEDGMPARKIIIESSAGKQAKLLDKTEPVLRNQAEFILKDRDLALTGNYEEIDGNLQVVLNLTVLADGYPDLTEELRFEVPVHKAPLDIISPSSGEIIVDGNTTQLILKTLPGSEVLINDNHYSHLLDDQGNLSVQLEVPDQAETPIEIKVSARGYKDNIETVLLKRQQMEFPLVIDQNRPIQAQQSEWVEVTGNTHPEAVLSTNLTLQGEPEIDAITGDFRLYVRATAKGYTPFVLTAQLEGKEDSILETVIERPVAETEYTGSAWASDYQEMKNYPNLHHGISFAFTGRIKDIQSSGSKTILLVDIATQGQAERIIHVEYWKPGSFVPDERIRLFGNYWGNKDDKPYVLAYFIYK